MFPKIIQGGMGVAVSDWRLAHAVASQGQMGVVSGTGIDTVFARRLQMGDIGGHMRQALEEFPIREMAERIWNRYFVEGGKALSAPFKAKPIATIDPPQSLLELTVIANFVEVYLAKRGHNGLVGINLLEKIQLPTLPSLYGAMLAGVDYVLMGAGIPRAIPGALDRLAKSDPTDLAINVAGALAGETFTNHFDPTPFVADGQTELKRPNFLAIVSSATLASSLAKKASGRIDGFVIEYNTAGGHNAPPRGAMQLDESGEPVYGPRDEPDLAQIRDLGLPFWLAGSFGKPGKLEEAIGSGAKGIQVGTAFAFCSESGLGSEIKKRVIRQSIESSARVFTDPLASSTGFPFKVVQAPETLAEEALFQARRRICDLGYLRECYRQENGTVGYRCPSEPVEDFVRKGGTVEETEGRKCICNGLLSLIGLGQTRKDGYIEPPLVTAGNDVAEICQFLKPGSSTYTAEDVLSKLLSMS